MILFLFSDLIHDWVKLTAWKVSVKKKVPALYIKETLVVFDAKSHKSFEIHPSSSFVKQMTIAE